MLPQASFFLQVGSRRALPLQSTASAADLCVIVTGWPQLSVAVALPVLLGSVDSPQASVASAGHAITGAIVSATAKIGREAWRERVEISAVAVSLKKELPGQVGGIGVSVWLIVTG